MKMYTLNPAYSAHVARLQTEREVARKTHLDAQAIEGERWMAHQYGRCTRNALDAAKRVVERTAAAFDDADRAWEARQESARALGLID